MIDGASGDMSGDGAAAACVAALLAEVVDAPHFPFDDWPRRPESFAAITAFWKKLFRSAAGERADDYRDTGHVEMDECSYGFDVANHDYSRRIRGDLSSACSDICVIWNDATDDYRPDLLDLGFRPDRAELCLQSRMQPAELIAVFEMIRAFTIAEIPSREACEVLERAFRCRWGDAMGILAAASWARSPDTDYSAFAGRPAFARLNEIAHNFDFGPHLPPATFPPDFVAAYEATASDDPVDWDGERTYFVAHFSSGDEVIMFDGLFSPDTIQSENAIISNVFGSERSAPILPPGHYAVGEAFGDLDTYRILICLDPDADDYGHLFLWCFTSEKIERDDAIADPLMMAPLASRLEEFWSILTTRPEANAAALGSPHLLTMTPKLSIAVDHAAKVFAPYLGSARFQGVSSPSDLSPKDLATLRRVGKQPAQQIPGSLIIDWQQSAHYPRTVEAQHDLRALLPRTFALIAESDPDVLEYSGSALSKLGAVDWRSTWTDEEVFAVNHFGMSLFEDCLASDGIGPFWQGPKPLSLRTALQLPIYLQMLVEGGFDLDLFTERWIEKLAFEDVGAVRHAASMMFILRRDIDGVFVDLGLPLDRYRAALGRLAAMMFDQAEWAIRCRLYRQIDDDEKRLLTDALAHLARLRPD